MLKLKEWRKGYPKIEKLMPRLNPAFPTFVNLAIAQSINLVGYNMQLISPEEMSFFIDHPRDLKGIYNELDTWVATGPWSREIVTRVAVAAAAATTEEGKKKEDRTRLAESEVPEQATQPPEKKRKY